MADWKGPALPYRGEKKTFYMNNQTAQQLFWPKHYFGKTKSLQFYAQISWNTKALHFKSTHLHLAGSGAGRFTLSNPPGKELETPFVHTWGTGLPCCARPPSGAPRRAGQGHWTAAGAQPCPVSLGDTENKTPKVIRGQCSSLSLLGLAVFWGVKDHGRWLEDGCPPKLLLRWARERKI